MNLLFGLLPLVAFVIIDNFLGLKSGLIAAIILAFLEAGYSIFVFGSLDALSIASLVLVLAFGFWSLKSQKPIYIKLQPVIFGLIFSVVILVLQYLNKPLLPLFLDKYGEQFPKEIMYAFAHQNMRGLLSQLSLNLGIGILIHAVLVAYAAFRLNNWWWLLIRGIGFYLMMALCILSARL
ncbi:MAG: septation protein IspZ [Myxococcales bacterium]|nr:MAG: septation protein IspZ [Myxococcales bacterium]